MNFKKIPQLDFPKVDFPHVEGIDRSRIFWNFKKRKKAPMKSSTKLIKKQLELKFDKK